MKKIEIELEDQLYEDITELYEALGLDVETAINIFLRQSLQRQGIPFKVRLPKPEPQPVETFMENPIINDLTF